MQGVSWSEVDEGYEGGSAVRALERVDRLGKF